MSHDLDHSKIYHNAIEEINISFLLKNFITQQYNIFSQNLKLSPEFFESTILTLNQNAKCIFFLSY